MHALYDILKIATKLIQTCLVSLHLIAIKSLMTLIPNK